MSAWATAPLWHTQGSGHTYRHNSDDDSGGDNDQLLPPLCWALCGGLGVTLTAAP